MKILYLALLISLSLSVSAAPLTAPTSNLGFNAIDQEIINELVKLFLYL